MNDLKINLDNIDCGNCRRMTKIRNRLTGCQWHKNDVPITKVVSCRIHNTTAYLLFYTVTKNNKTTSHSANIRYCRKGDHYTNEQGRPVEVSIDR